MISDLRKVPVIRAVFPFVAGIIAAATPGAGDMALLRGSFPVLIVCLLLLSLPVKRYPFREHTARGLLLFISFMLMGYWHHAASRMYRPVEGNLDFQEGYLEGIVVDGAVEKGKTWLVRLEGKTFMNDSIRTVMDEYVQVYLPADANIQGLLPGEHLLVRGRLSRIRNNGNPGEFDYAGYMDRKRTRYQVFVRDPGLFRVLGERETAQVYGPARLRQRIIGGWDREDPDVAVLSALTLGYKSWLDQETKSTFSDAGAMHLLAVSGLHVGMIWWILEKLIRVPAGRSAWHRLKLVIIVVVLWGYAAVTGFSDSVTRSVTMFSLLTLSRSIQRHSNIYNTLLLSAFLLLLLKPSRIVEPGFQLSYIAVAGIVTIQPRMEKLYTGVHWTLHRVLDLVSVSIAAQVSTLPLVLTYFHQFPVWFLLTNLAAIPLVSLILALFVMFIPFLMFFPDWELFSQVLLWVTGVLNRAVTGIASLPGSVVSNVVPDPAGMSLLLGLLMSACMFMYYRSVYFLAFAFLLLSAAIALPVLRVSQLDENASITIFNMNDATMISHVQNAYRETCLWPADSFPDPYLLDYVQSLSGSPPGVRSHRVVRLDENEPRVESSCFRITEGLWGIRSGSWNILIVGDCEREMVQQAIHSYYWQVVLFRKGTPLYGLGDFMATFGGRVVGDGTLRQYEMKLLSQQVPAIWLTGKEGVLVLHMADLSIGPTMR
ncbi:MAG: ComEC/Rec2 family competence protein [Bacteroidales bacterium]|nr:ComEC/Rec2 family competence protein [Bacteroidales bacterium]MDT8432548.1 ComEC/Rec2 family competence protein [Bacteroidales bacterium]